MNIYKIPACVGDSWERHSLKLILLSCLLCLSTIGISQAFIGNLHSGLNLSQLSGDDLNGFRKLGLHAGASVSYPWSNTQKQISLEFLYQQKGSRQGDNAGDLQQISVNTLSIPLIYRWGEWYNEQIERHNFYVEIGATVNAINNVQSENTFFDNRTDEFKNFDWGLLAGIKISINRKFSTTIRYERSVTDLFNDPALSLRGLQSFLFTLRLDYGL